MSNNIDKKQETFCEIFEHICVSLIAVGLITSLIVLLFLKHFASCEEPVIIQSSRQNVIITNKTNKKIIIIDEHGIIKKNDEEK